MTNKHVKNSSGKGKLPSSLTYQTPVTWRRDLDTKFSNAIELHRSGQFSKAKKIYDDILAGQPLHYEALHLSGLLAHQTGSHDSALALIDKAISIQSNNAIFYNHKGLVLSALGDYNAAIENYTKALNLNPKLAAAYINRGNALDAIDEYEKAIESYDLAIETDPNALSAYLNKAIILEKIGQSDYAISTCDAALKIAPKSAQAYSSRGMSLVTLGKFDDAIIAFNYALTINPTLAQALCNRGIAYQRAAHYRQGLDDFNRCIELDPMNSNLYFNRGFLLYQLGDLDGALSNYESAISLNPHNAEAQFNKALLHLSKKEFQLGWGLYEWRFVNPKEPQARLITTLPTWNPQNMSHQRVLLWGEQGIGDQVLFGTMLRDAKEAISELTVMLDQRLIPIFKRSMPDITFITINSPINEQKFDAQFPMMSLGAIFRSTEDQFKKQTNQYLLADTERAKILKRELVSSDNLLCGIFWKSRHNKNEFKKSLTLLEFLPVLQISGLTFVNLQYGDTADECKVFKEQTGI